MQLFERFIHTDKRTAPHLKVSNVWVFPDVRANLFDLEKRHQGCSGLSL